jgi:hypothetical protein
MQRWFSSLALALSPFALVVVTALQLGCYKPNIEDGGLLCNFDAGAKLCPEGYRCDTASKRCYQHPDAAVDRPDGDRADVPDMGTDADGGGPCFDPRPACTPGSGMCDPFCRTGCGCYEKCSVNTAGALTCNELAPGQRRNAMDPCQIVSANRADQTDQCAPGLVCLEDACGGGSAGRCYQFCRVDNDCTNAPCNKDVGGSKVCDVPYDECVPLAVPNNTGCQGTAIGCYLSTSDPSKTICDCPGGLAEDDVCTRSRDCFPGLVCVDKMNLGSKQCARVCRLGVPSDCPGTCRTYMSGGVSNVTYGYCGL